MRIYLALLILVAFIPINVKTSATPAYLGCFQDCYSGSCSNTVNQYSNGREIQFYGLKNTTSMTNELCISKCKSYDGTFHYASTQFR